MLIILVDWYIRPVVEVYPSDSQSSNDQAIQGCYSILLIQRVRLAVDNHDRRLRTRVVYSTRS